MNIYMRKILLSAALLLAAVTGSAQEERNLFKGYFVNEDLNVYMRMDLQNSMDIPDHELFGPLPGFLAKQHNGFYWLIIDAHIKNNKKATIQLVNDYGSEDLTATIRIPNDSVMILEQVEGSPIKVPKDGKWFKLPSKITFKRKL